MKIKTTLLYFIFLSIFKVVIAGNFYPGDKGGEITYINNKKRLPDLAYQNELRRGKIWQDFLKKNGIWYVDFNEENAKPHRAFGKPIAVSGANAKEKAFHFITNELNAFNIPVNELNLSNVLSSSSYDYVNFHQLYKGLKVLNSRLTVKLASHGNVVMFGLDVFNDININTIAKLTGDEALESAEKDLLFKPTKFSVNPNLMVLPIPALRKNDYKLVYEIILETLDQDQVPAIYYTLVDAQTGNVLYRNNKVKSIGKKKLAVGMDVNVSANVYPTNPYNPSEIKPLANVKILVGSDVFFTDKNGNLPLADVSPVSATVFLEGKWSAVMTNNIIPQVISTLDPGSNSISFGQANVKELSAYYHINIVHDYMKTKFPEFDKLDFPLPANIDIDLNGKDCNAFYDGTSLNFLSPSAACNSFAQVGDIIYHEYGHAISDMFYIRQGSFFENHAMGEGYADIWAMGITKKPILGVGGRKFSASQYFRRYDKKKKVYPVDIIGEEHNDGEIIAGAWWDLGQKLGDLSRMMDLFSQTYYGLVSGPDGTEGQVFFDILVEVLQADDASIYGGDNDITNGTPNDKDIIDAFSNHGITLLSNSSITHHPISESANDKPVTINTNITLQYPWAFSNAKVFYKLNRSSIWKSIPMTPTNALEYTAEIPAQPAGTIIAYYLGLENSYGVISPVLPFQADDSNPNIPYFILNGFSPIQTEDFENTQNNWMQGIPSDDASSGQWTIGVPIPSFRDDSFKVIVQPRDQTTPNGSKCAFTGNANSEFDIPGANDVDKGETTFESPAFDLTTYNNPVFSYNRWYTNNTSLNPANDTWEVQISKDNIHWTKVERTNVSDKSWRFMAFRVKDYFSTWGSIKLRFVAEDSLVPGLEYDGGSLVEAAIDDLKLYEQHDITSIINIDRLSNCHVYPNPAADLITIAFTLDYSQDIKVEMINFLGQVVLEEMFQNINGGNQKIKLSTRDLPSGIYMLAIRGKDLDQIQGLSLVK